MNFRFFSISSCFNL